MSVVITVSLGNDRLTLRNREIEHLEVASRLGEPHRCIVRFDLDTNYSLCLQDFHGQATVTIAQEDGSSSAVLFEGVMTGGYQDHQLRGGSRFEVRAASPLLLALQHRNQPMQEAVAWDDVVGALHLTVVGASRFPRTNVSYRHYGGSWLEFAQRLADGRGYFLIERGGNIELHSEFIDDNRRDLTWGLNLLAIRATSELVNYRFRGGVEEVGTKSDYRFRDQRKEPTFTGAIPLVNAVKDAAQSFAVPLDPNYVLSDSRANSKSLFRDVLQQESERTLGAAVTIHGESKEFLLKLGETVETIAGASFPLPGSVGVFGVVELTHIWDAAEYRNRFKASPWKNYSNSVTPPQPPYSGPQLAEVQTTQPAELARGLIRVRLTSTMMCSDETVILARMVSPFTGNQRGITFVPEPHDEVLVIFSDGNPEYPYVVGSLWSPKDACLGLEPKQIVTKNGNVLALHDDGWIELYTPEGKCMLQMSSGGDKTPRVTLHSEGDLIFEAKGQIQLRAASLHEAISGGVKREIKGDESATIGGNMKLSVSGNLTVDGATAVVTGGTGKLSLTNSSALLASSTTAILNGGSMAVVTGALVQLNPPVVPPDVPVVSPPPQLPDELKTSWDKRSVPAATPPFDSDQDPAPSAS